MTETMAGQALSEADTKEWGTDAMNLLTNFYAHGAIPGRLLGRFTERQAAIYVLESIAQLITTISTRSLWHCGVGSTMSLGKRRRKRLRERLEGQQATTGSPMELRHTGEGRSTLETSVQLSQHLGQHLPARPQPGTSSWDGRWSPVTGTKSTRSSPGAHLIAACTSSSQSAVQGLQQKVRDNGQFKSHSYGRRNGSARTAQPLHPTVRPTGSTASKKVSEVQSAAETVVSERGRNVLKHKHCV
eukprot:s87_g32.t1